MVVIRPCLWIQDIILFIFGVRVCSACPIQSPVNLLFHTKSSFRKNKLHWFTKNKNGEDAKWMVSLEHVSLFYKEPL